MRWPQWPNIIQCLEELWVDLVHNRSPAPTPKTPVSASSTEDLLLKRLKGHWSIASTAWQHHWFRSTAPCLSHRTVWQNLLEADPSNRQNSPISEPLLQQQPEHKYPSAASVILPARLNRTPPLSWQPPSPGVSTKGFDDGRHERHQPPASTVQLLLCALQ